MIHCRSATEMSSARWAEGRAMFTTVESRITISWAMAMTASAHQRKGSTAGSAAVDPGVLPVISGPPEGLDGRIGRAVAVPHPPGDGTGNWHERVENRCLAAVLAKAGAAGREAFPARRS